MRHKKAQVSNTMMWIVATIVIIVILAVSMFLTTLFGKRIYVDTNMEEGTDLLVTKSLTSYLLTKESGDIIYNKINQDNDLDNFNAPFSINVFVGLYKNDYPRGIWFDVRGNGAQSSSLLRRRYYEDYYRNNLGNKEYSYSITSPTIVERIFFGSIPDKSKTKNLILALRE